jgi:predicted esterase
VDIALFETILGCLGAQQNIDTSRIYSFGFSAGAVMTNLVHSRHPKVLAAVVTESGAWMNDKAEKDIVNFPGIQWNWPALEAADRGNVLLTHGGPSDVTVFNILDLEKSAQLAIPFLLAAKRTVVDCSHTTGHKLHPDLGQTEIRKYLFAHTAGAPSPYASGAASGLPSSCQVRLP